MPLHHAAVVAAGDRVWVVGGYTTGADATWRPTASVFSLGAGEEVWQREADLATPRGALAAAAGESGRIVAAGGVGPGGDVLDSVEVLEPGADSWEAGPAMVTAREHFAMAAAGADVYAIAGRAGGLDTNIDSVEVLRDASWEPAGALARARGGIGAATVGDTVCVAGGEEPGGTIAEVECRRDGEWAVVAELGTPRHGLAVAGLDGALHVVGGGPEPGLHVSDAHEVLELSGA